nr:hypothetical protein BaRGS_022839 [Batillaria attramentaria]
MKVEELLSEEMFDPTHPADLQLMDLTVRTLLSPGHHVTDSDLENIIEALRRRQSDGVYKSIVRLRLAQCMASITQEDEAATVPQKFPYSVIDPSLSVRLFVSTAVKRLFVVEINGKLVPQEKKQQHEAFDLLYDICNDMMDVKQFMHKNMAGVEEIARSLNQGMEETLKGCLPDILVHILPLFAVSKSPQLSGDLGVRRHLATANACYDLLVQQLGQDTIDKSIMSQLGTVVVRIFGCLKLQETGSADDQGENNHESNPPSYCKDMSFGWQEYPVAMGQESHAEMDKVLRWGQIGFSQVHKPPQALHQSKKRSSIGSKNLLLQDHTGTVCRGIVFLENGAGTNGLQG